MALPYMSAQEAAEFINNGDAVGLSGFTAAGTPKVVPYEIANKARREHEAGRPFRIDIYTGASTNDSIDGALTREHAMRKRSPYQSTPDSRKAINSREVEYFDVHLSEMAQNVRYGVLGTLHAAIIEAQSVTESGDIVLGEAVGCAPTYATMAEKVIIELNEAISPRIYGLHDVYITANPPYRREIPIYKASDRIGSPVVHIDPAKIVAVVRTNCPPAGKPFTPADEVTETIGANVCQFLSSELKAGRIPSSFLPLQSGVGNVANAVLAGLDADPDIPPFDMYTEVIQDSVLKLLESGKCRFASTSSMTFSKDAMEKFYDNIDYFHSRIMLRPSEISNHPEVVRRLGIISMNTALEADIFGNINSTCVSGVRMMNGIGGSADFTRNAYVSIFSCPSVAKKGLISAIVPMVSHLDHSDHSVDILITEQGIADMRAKSPMDRAKAVIENCAHPDYRPLLREYLAMSKSGYMPHTLRAAFAMHEAFTTEGDMHLTDFSKYGV